MTNRATKAWFGQAVEEALDSLYGLALRLTRNETDAEDLVAESVAKAWSAIDTLDDRNRFRSWLFRILHNRFVSDYRKSSVRPQETPYEETPAGDEDELVALLIRQPDEFLSWWGNPEKEFFNNLLGETIMSAIESLPEVFRTTVMLVNVDGLAYDEAAEVLSVPAGTVRSRMKRGRTLLQKALWDHAKEAGLLEDDDVKEVMR
jgi:RNA polymerase sigma-70 factor (ECF subfamily)